MSKLEELIEESVTPGEHQNTRLTVALVETREDTTELVISLASKLDSSCHSELWLYNIGKDDLIKIAQCFLKLSEAFTK